MRKLRSLLVGYLATSLVAAPAYAEELRLDEIEDVEVLVLEELLEAPISAASRYEQRPADSPTLVSILDRNQLTAFGYRTVGEALQGVRGVYTSNDRNYSYLGSRGFGIPGDYNTRFAVTIDNHRMNDTTFGQGLVGAELNVPMAAIERVELVRGGAWSVHGDNALLGAVRIVTATGASRPGLHVQSTARATAETYSDPANRSTVASRGEDVSTSYGYAGGKNDVFVAAQYTHDPGLQRLYMPDLASGDEPCMTPRGELTPCDGIVHGGDGEEQGSMFASLRSGAFRFRGMAGRRVKRASTASFGTTIGESLSTQDDRVFGDVEYSRTSDHTDVVARIAADYSGYSGLYPQVQLSPESPMGYERADNVDFGNGTWWTGELRGRYKHGTVGSWLRDLEVGGSFELSAGESSQGGGYELPTGYESYLDRTDPSQSAAVGAHTAGRAFDHVVAFGAVRGDYQADTSTFQINPQAGLVLDGEELGRIRASYSRGSRAPNPYELHYWPSFTDEPVPELEAEVSSTRELSLERYLGPNMRLLVVGFDQRVSNLLGLTTVDDRTLYTNLPGSVRSRGIETELEGRWQKLRMRASYAYQRTRTADGAVPANAPSSLGSFMLLAPIAKQRAMIGVESTFIGQRTSHDGSVVSAQFATNLVMNIPRIVRDVDLSAGVTNLFDQRTASPSSEEHRQSSIPNDPRTVWLRLSIALVP